jgi:hypothetical protein
MPLALVAAITVGPLALFVSGRLTPAEAISGFANPATVAVLAILILAGGLMRTGAIASLGRWIDRVVGRGIAFAASAWPLRHNGVGQRSARLREGGQPRVGPEEEQHVAALEHVVGAGKQLQLLRLTAARPRSRAIPPRAGRIEAVGDRPH